MSIDIGLKNMAFCILECYRGVVTVRAWWKEDFTKDNKLTIFLSNIFILDSLNMWLKEGLFAGLDKVRVEEQNLSVSKIKGVFNTVFAWFYLKKDKYGWVLVKVNSKKKNDFWSKVYESPIPDTYSARKRWVTKLVPHVLTAEVKHHLDWLKKYQNETKKDDLADCFLDALCDIKQEHVIDICEK